MIKRKTLKAGLLILSAFVLTLSSCKKDEDDNSPDKPNTNITIISPANGAIVNESDTVWIKVNITSDEELHDYLISVKNTKNNKEVYSYNGHSHNKSVTTNLYYLPVIMGDADMELTVTKPEEDGTSTQKSVTFKVKENVAATKPVITLSSPIQSEYHNGETVMIKGNINHNTNLKEVKIQVTKDGGSVLNLTPDVTGKSSYSFDTSYKITGANHSNFSVSISAIDINDQSEVKTFYFHVH